MSVTTQVLSNNIILIAEPDASVQTVALGFWFRTGSRYEPPELRGISHFTEHMLFKGTATRTAFDIATAFDRIGGYINAFTERENLCVHCVVPAEHTSVALDVLCDMTMNSMFDSREVGRERSVIQNEIILSLDDPEETALDAASEAVWPGHPVSASIAGTVDDVAHLTETQLREWYAAHIRGGVLVVCAAGNVNPDLLVRQLEKLPPRLSAGDFESQIAGLAPPVWQSGVRFVEASFRQMQFFMQLPVAQPVTERQYYTLAILNALIGDTMSSRLFQKLREEGAYSYNVYSFFTFYRDAACWCAYASSSRKNAVRVTDALFSELRTLVHSGFRDDELTAACEHLCGEEIISSEEIEYRMKRLARNSSFGFPQRSTGETVACIRSITRSEVEQELVRLLDLSNAGFLVYGPRPAQSVADKIQYAAGIG